MENDYSEERCVANNPKNATMMACSFQNAGLRVFDIRDPYHPKEIAYWSTRENGEAGSGFPASEANSPQAADADCYVVT